MNKNTDPKKLDPTNIGDCMVLRMPNGDTRSVTMRSFVGGEVPVAQFVWKTGPRSFDSTTLYVWEWRDEGRIEAIFPADCKFLAV
jgi:hypothetical protein